MLVCFSFVKSKASVNTLVFRTTYWNKLISNYLGKKGMSRILRKFFPSPKPDSANLKASLFILALLMFC